MYTNMNTVRASTMIQPQWTPNTLGRTAALLKLGMIWLPGLPSQGPPWSQRTTPMMI